MTIQPTNPSSERAELIRKLDNAKKDCFSIGECWNLMDEAAALLAADNPTELPDAYNRKLGAQLEQEWCELRRLKLAYTKPASQQALVPLTRCAAGSDGDCFHKNKPALPAGPHRKGASMKNIYAFTEIAYTQPAYISINAIPESAHVRITVREQGRDYGSNIELSPQQCEQLAIALASHINGPVDATTSRFRGSSMKLPNWKIDDCWNGLTPDGSGKSRYDIARAIEAEVLRINGLEGIEENKTLYDHLASVDRQVVVAAPRLFRALRNLLAQRITVWNLNHDD